MISVNIYSTLLYCTVPGVSSTAFWHDRLADCCASAVPKQCGLYRAASSTHCSCEPLMKAWTMFCEPATARAWALLAFGGARLAKGCGPDKSAVVEPFAFDFSGRIERRSWTTSQLYFSSLRVASSRGRHSVSRWDNVSTETPRSLSRAAHLSSSYCCIFEAPLCLISPNVESASSLAANAVGSKRTARSVSWFCQKK